jgi:hypothetical protein
MSTQDKLKCGIDIQSADEYDLLNRFVTTLMDIKIFSSFNVFKRCHDALESQYYRFFCSDHDTELNRHGECNRCNNEESHYDYDRAYDEWKDRMLEDESNK